MALLCLYLPHYFLGSINIVMRKYSLLLTPLILLGLFSSSCEPGGTKPPGTDSLKTNTVMVDIADYWAPACGADHKYGYINTKGEWMVKPAFSRAFPFSEGRAMASNGAYPNVDYFVINTKGEKVIDPEGIAVAGGPCRFGVMAIGYMDSSSEKYTYRFMDTTGKFLPVGKLDNAYLYSPDGIYPVKSPEGKYGFQNSAGEWVIRPQFKAANYQHDFGLAPVETEAGTGYIDLKGNVKVPFRYAAAYPFFEGRSVFKTKEGVYGYIDTTGTEHMAPQGVELYAFFSSDLVGAKQNNIWGFMDPSFNWVIQPKWYELSRPRDWGRFSEGLRAVMTGEKSNPMFIYIDPKGNVVLDGKYNMAGDFKNGIAVASLGQAPNVSFGVINKEGKWAIEPIFADISKFTKINETQGR